MQNPSRLINISQGGLCILLINQHTEPTSCKAVDILCIRPDTLYLPGVVCRVIYDISTLSENMSFTGAETRYCGLQFTSFNFEQKQKLMNFLDKMLVGGKA